MHLPSPPIFKQSINHWVSPYLSHVANDNRHDDAIDGHSFTEDNADNSNGKGWGGVEKREEKEISHLSENPQPALLDSR